MMREISVEGSEIVGRQDDGGERAVAHRTEKAART
jgi:hypothetical protein